MSYSILTICACVHVYVQEFRASSHMMHCRLVDRRSVCCLLCLGVGVGPLPCMHRSVATVQWGVRQGPHLLIFQQTQQRPTHTTRLTKQAHVQSRSLSSQVLLTLIPSVLHITFRHVVTQSHIIYVLISIISTSHNCLWKALWLLESWYTCHLFVKLFKLLYQNFKLNFNLRLILFSV
jgi:hypothetical protein